MDPSSSLLSTKSGRPLHPIGIGTWTFGEYSLHSPGADAEVAAIEYALSLGQNHIDTAEMYGNGGAEQVVGRAISKVPREDIYVATKLWKTHVLRGTVRPAVEAMLKRLGTDYIDLLYIHAPWHDVPWQQSVPEICQLIDEGVVRQFGVSNFNVERMNEVIGLSTQPIVANQMHYSFGHRTEVTPELKALCEANGTTIVAYRPLERGELFENSELSALAKQHDATQAQAALAWLIAQGALPIPKARSRAHIDENFAAASLHLPKGAE